MARHGSIAEQLAPVIGRLFQAEAVEPTQSNWCITPSFVVADKDELSGMFTECRLRTRPSLREIEAGLVDVEFNNRNGRVIPVGGDVERNDSGAIIRLGKLCFSDGAQTEKAYKVTIDGKVVTYDARMPTGAMLGTSEGQERTLGGTDEDGVTESNRFVADTLGVAHRGCRPRGAIRWGEGPVPTRRDAIAMLDAAITNTQVMPQVKRCPPGVACGTSKVIDQFVGMRINATGGDSGMSWVDISTSLADRDAWAAAVDALKDEDKAVIKATRNASSLRQVGSSLGFGAGGQSMRKVKSMMMAANDNLARNYKKVS